LPSIPWESIGKAGREKQFEVEELFLACPPLTAGLQALEFFGGWEILQGELSKAVGWSPVKKEAPSPRLCRDGASGIA
jgi:hypothetical protein